MCGQFSLAQRPHGRPGLADLADEREEVFQVASGPVDLRHQDAISGLQVDQEPTSSRTVPERDLRAGDGLVHVLDDVAASVRRRGGPLLRDRAGRLRVERNPQVSAISHAEPPT